MDRLRDNPSEFRAINIARYLDKPENTQALAEELIKHIDNSVEAIVLPACIGLDEEAPVNLLQECVGKTNLSITDITAFIIRVFAYIRH